MQPNNRPILDPRMSHRRPVVSTAELDRRAATAAQPVQPGQDITGHAVYGPEVTMGGLSSRPVRRGPDRGMRFLVIIAAVVVLAAVGLFVASRLGSSGGGNGDEDKEPALSGGGIAADDERREDINTMATALQLYSINNSGRFPTNEQLNDNAWRAANIPSLLPNILTDPEGTYPVLALAAAANSYAYIVGPTAGLSKPCDNTTIPCSQYKLTATLSDGAQYTLN